MRAAFLLLVLAAKEPPLELRLERDYTPHDAIPAAATLLRTPGIPAEGYPEVILAREGAPPRALRLQKKRIDGESRDPKAGPGEMVASWSFDLRRLFGPLEPGTYRVTLKLGDAVAETALTITAASLKDAEKAAIPEVGLDLVVKGGTATLRNRLREEVRVANLAGTGAPLQPPFLVERFHPAQGWIAVPMGFCGTGMGEAVLPAGGTADVVLRAPRAGILRFVLPVTAGGKEIRVVSNPVLADPK